MKKRQLDILGILSIRKKIDVSELSDLCDVSAVTIRKDLDLLESNGFLKREHGFAVLNNEDNINYRLALGYQEKQVIALKALDFIEPNETVVIESGSSCTLLAMEIAKRNQKNTIITNSTFIARYLEDYPQTKIIVLGGEYQSGSEAIVGPLIRDFIKNFNVKKLFIGADGIDEEHGVTSTDYDRCEAVKIMLEHTKELYVLSQGYKVEKYSSYSICPLSQVKYLITDDNVLSDEVVSLEKHGLLVE